MRWPGAAAEECANETPPGGDPSGAIPSAEKLSPLEFADDSRRPDRVHATPQEDDAMTGTRSQLTDRCVAIFASGAPAAVHVADEARCGCRWF